jgi:hypothetical protein
MKLHFLLTGDGSHGVSGVQPTAAPYSTAAAAAAAAGYDPHTTDSRGAGLRGRGGLLPQPGRDWRRDSDMALFGQTDVDARVDMPPRLQGLIAGTIRDEIMAIRAARDVDLRGSAPFGHRDGDERRDRPPRGLFGEEDGDGNQASLFGQTDQDYRLPPRDRDYREGGGQQQPHMDRDYRGSAAPPRAAAAGGDRAAYPRDKDSRVNDQDYRSVPPMYNDRRGGPRGGPRGGGGFRGGRPYGPPRGAGHRGGGGRGGMGPRGRGGPHRGGPPRGREQW